MSAIVFDSARSVKSDRTFGDPPPRETRRPYTWQDLQDAAQMYGDIEADRHCAVCGADAENGLCPRCEERAEEASVASMNYAAGLGFRVF
jgi:hypothetical protein